MSEINEKALARLGPHIDMMSKLSSMVASELAVADGLTDAQAMMAVAQAFISLAAHTAVTAAREYHHREPEYRYWKESCDEAFQRAAGRVDALGLNIPGGDAT